MKLVDDLGDRLKELEGLESHRAAATAAIVARTSLEEALFTSLTELRDPVGFLQGNVEVPA
jgi:hypothetical protein